MKSIRLFALLIPSLICAQESEKGVLERIIQPKLSVDSSYLAPASIEGHGGKVRVHKNRIKINNDIVGISYTHWDFKWDDVAQLPFGDGQTQPISSMHAIKLNINAPYFINDQWFVLSSLSLRSVYEKSMQDSYGGSVFAFASYRLDQDHAFQMGAFANYHKVSTLALPALSYSYRARQKDGFQLILGFPRAYAGYHINKDTMLKFGAIFSQSVIKLRNDSPIENKGYIEAEDYVSNLGVQYDISTHIRLEANALYSFKRNFIIYNAQGDEVSSYNVSPSWGTHFKLMYIF